MMYHTHSIHGGKDRAELCTQQRHADPKPALRPLDKQPTRNQHTHTHTHSLTHSLTHSHSSSLLCGRERVRARHFLSLSPPRARFSLPRRRSTTRLAASENNSRNRRCLIFAWHLQFYKKTQQHRQGLRQFARRRPRKAKDDILRKPQCRMLAPLSCSVGSFRIRARLCYG